MRLAPEENASATVITTAQDLRGHWDGGGTYIPSDPNARDREYRVEGRVMGRIGRHFQFGGIVPVLHTTRKTVDSSSSGGGLGDVTVLTRWDFVKPGGEGAWPGIAATMSLSLPTGRSPFNSKDPSLADVTGAGAYELRPGIALEKNWWTGWYVIAAAGVGFYAPFKSDRDVTIQLGPRMLAFVAVGKSWTNGLGLAGALSYDREAGPRVDGVRSVLFRARPSAMLFGSYAVDDHWTLIASGQWDLPISGLGREQLAGITVGLGVRRAWNVY
jgi:hypothetical protein